MQDFTKLIEELKAGNDEIENERAKLEAFFLSIGEGAIITDADGKISKVNDVGAKLLGFKPEELIGKWYPKMVVALDDEGKTITTIERPITRAFLTGKPVSAKLFYKRKDGSSFPVSATCSPVIHDGRPIGAIQVFHDNTHEYEVDRMKSEFISIASHQLRTPLTSIMTSSHMLADGYLGQLTEQQMAFMDNILYSVGRMQDLISTLLNISRIEAGKMSVVAKPTDLKELAEALMKEIIPHTDEKKQTVDLDLKKVAKISTDPLLVKEVLANLMTNASKYSPAEGKIRLAIASKGEDILITVQDNGYGIPKAQQDKIFGKFFRADNIIKQEGVGTGLGLYMVKGIADALGGKIWFKSRENEGTTFYFALPKKGTKTHTGSTRLEH